MLRRLGGCAIALALLLPTQATASPSSAPQSSADQRAAATKSRVVKLGHKPVRTTTATKVRLTFKGRKGQLVNLARLDAADQCGGRTLRRGGKTVKPWAQGFWSLPRTTTYTAINKPCRGDERALKLQVRRVVREDVAVPGLATTIGKRADVTHLVPVRVRTGERVGLQPTSPTVEVVGPDRRTTVADATSVLRATGRHWVVLAPESSLTTTLTVRREAQVDGATIALPRMGTADTTHEVAFTGTAGQWVYAELLDSTGNAASDTSRAIRVIGPDGTEVKDVILNDCDATSANRGCTLRGPWRLPASGSYTMDVSADNASTEQSTTLRIRAAAVAPDLTIDGPAVTYAATSPGQWVVGRYEWSRTYYVDGVGRTGTVLEAGRISPSLGSWVVTALPHLPYAYDCGYEKSCDYHRTVLTPSVLRNRTPASWWQDDRGPWAVLVVPPNAQGSMDLTLTRHAEQP